jgi:hypothetical protein
LSRTSGFEETIDDSVPTPKAFLDFEDLVGAEELLLGHIALQADLDADCGVRSDVPQPLTFAPDRYDRRFMRLAVVALDVEDGSVLPAGATADVREHEQRVAGQPAEPIPPQKLQTAARPGDEAFPEAAVPGRVSWACRGRGRRAVVRANVSRTCLGLSLRRHDDVLDRLLEAASGAVDHVLVEPRRRALRRGDELDLIGGVDLERIRDRLHGVGVAEASFGANPIACEAGDTGAQALCRVRARGVFVDVPSRRSRAVGWSDDEGIGLAAAGVGANALAKLG